MSGSHEDDLLEGVNDEHRRLLLAARVADLSDDEAEVFLCALDAPDLATMAWELELPPGVVRELLVSAYRKIQGTGLVEPWELPEVPGL